MNKKQTIPSLGQRIYLDKIIKKLKQFSKRPCGYINLYYTKTHHHERAFTDEEIKFIVKNKFNFIENWTDFIHDIYDGYGGTGFVVWFK